MKFKSMLQVAVLGGAAIAASAALANGYDYKVAPAAPAKSYDGSGFVLGIQGGYADTHWDNLFPNIDHTGFTGRGYAGYDFNSYFGAELGYIYLPKAKESFNNSFGNGNISISNYAVDLLGKLSYPIANGFSIFAKAGGAYFHSNTTLSGTFTVLGTTYSGSDSEGSNHIGPAFGVGMAYDITPQLGVNLSWMRYSGQGDLHDDNYQPSPDVVLLGLSYKFPVNWS